MRFESRIGLPSELYHLICDLLREDLAQKEIPLSLQSIPTRILTVEKALFCTGFGSRMKLMDIPDMYGVGKSIVGWVVRQFVKALLKHMDRFICCPAKEVASQQVKQGFEAQRGFPNFVGAIDNTHIENTSN